MRKKKKEKNTGQKQTTDFRFGANILLKIVYHCGAVALAIHVVLLLGTRLEKWHQLLIALSRELKYFDNVELVFPLNEFQICSIFNKFTENLNKCWLLVANTEPGFVIFFCEYIEYPTNLKLLKFFWIYFA